MNIMYLNSVHKRSVECRDNVDYQIYQNQFSVMIIQIKLQSLKANRVYFN
jgi:hypothetical protein